MTREVVVVSGVRTAVGTFGGSLKDQTPNQLAALVVRDRLPIRAETAVPAESELAESLAKAA